MNMRIHQLVLFVFVLIIAGCGSKRPQVDNEFLIGMSDEEIKKMETVEKKIVAIDEEQQAIRNMTRITQLRIQILNRERSLLEEKKSILNDKKNLYKLKNNPTRLKEVQEDIQKNKDKIVLKEMLSQILAAQLDDEKNQLEQKRAELAQKIAERSLMRARIARAQQDKVFGDDPERTDEKYDIALFEEYLNKTKLTFQEKEKLRLDTQNKLQELQSKYNQKQLLAPPVETSQKKTKLAEEPVVKATTPEEIQKLMTITQLEIKIAKQEKEQLEMENSILIDIERLYKFKNNSIKRKEAQEDIQNKKDEITIKGLLVQVLEARLADEKQQLEVKLAELEQEAAEKNLKDGQAKKVDVSEFKNQLKSKQLALQKKEELRLDTQKKLQEARRKLQEAQSKQSQKSHQASSVETPQTKPESTEKSEAPAAGNSEEKSASSETSPAETADEVQESLEAAPTENTDSILETESEPETTDPQ